MKIFIAIQFVFFSLISSSIYAQELPCIQARSLESETSVVSEFKPKIEKLSIALANASWTHEDAYEGRVILFSAKVHAIEGEKVGVDADGFKTQFFMATFDGEVQVGSDGVEHTYLNVTALTKEKVRELERDGKFHLVEKGMKLGNLQASRDLPLAQAGYVEVEPVKVYGTIGWSPSSSSDLEFLARVSLSLGYAHARSTKPEVENTNNFYVGQNYGITLKHRKFGQIDFDRGVDGEMTKYDPGSTSSREAYVKLGYTYNINEKSSITFAGEKRSFRFGPDYEKSRHYLLSYQRRFK